jgi:hypothetical protein
MLTPKLILGLFLVLSNISCSQILKGDTVLRSISKEDFLIFLSNFSSDTVYQKERLSTSFLECEVTIDGDSSCYNEKVSAWMHVKLIEEDKIYRIYNNYSKYFEDSDERLFSVEKIESGAATYYYFRRKKNGKWFLEKRVIYSD